MTDGEEFLKQVLNERPANGSNAASDGDSRQALLDLADTRRQEKQQYDAVVTELIRANEAMLATLTGTDSDLDQLLGEFDRVLNSGLCIIFMIPLKLIH